MQHYPFIHGYKVETVFKDSSTSLLFQIYDQDDQLVLMKVSKLTESNQENLILPKLQHPNIISALQVFDDPTAIMIPFIHSQTLDEYLLSTPPSFDILQKIFFDLIEGVEYIHTMGFLHGDLRPVNILMDLKHHPIIIDFAQASTIQNPRDRILPNTPLDTIAPEIKKGETWSIQSDIYGLGMVLEALLAKCIDPHNVEVHWYKVCIDCKEPQPENRPEGIQGLRSKLLSPSEKSALFEKPENFGISEDNEQIPTKWIFIGVLMIFLGIFLGLVIAS